MKKKLFFLITILGIFFLFQTKDVYAMTNFYEGDYINGIFMNRAKNGSIFYQKARFFNEVGTNKPAYCIEPSATFNVGSSYVANDYPNNIASSQKSRIRLLAHFGYGYPNRTDPKWYAITQLMIWQTVEINSDCYFTDSLNGNRISPYDNEIAEINRDVNDYNTLPSFRSQNVYLVEGESISLTDTNNVLGRFTTNLGQINGNTWTANNLKEGTYNVTFERKMQKNTQDPVVFYVSSDSQNLVTIGNVDSPNLQIRLYVKKTKLKITKIDADTKTTTPSGMGKLEGTTYELLDENQKLVKTITIGKDGTGSVENIRYGKYFLKEVKAGEGYEIDPTVHEVVFNNNNTESSFTFENKIIEKKVEITKLFGEENDFKSEEKAEFHIYDLNDNLIDAIATDENGHATITLPYGKYRVEQIKGKEGYKKVDDFFIDVTDKDVFSATIYDYKIKVPESNYKIKVPDTKTKANYGLLKSIFIVLSIIFNYYVNKKVIFG